MKFLVAAFCLPWLAAQLIEDAGAWLTGRAAPPMFDDEDFRFHGERQ